MPKNERPIESLIVTVRNTKVILDSDLAALYGVTTSRLNEQVKRNPDRFPADFLFQLTAVEWAEVKRNRGLDIAQLHDAEPDDTLRSQFAISKSQHTGEQWVKSFAGQRDARRRGGRRTRPYAFTEHGALMAANVLNSPDAVKMSVYVVRAFVQQRALLMTQAEILKKLAQIDATLLEHDAALRAIWTELQPLLRPPPDPPKRGIGFHAQEARARYGAARRSRV